MLSETTNVQMVFFFASPWHNHERKMLPNIAYSQIQLFEM